MARPKLGSSESRKIITVRLSAKSMDRFVELSQEGEKWGRFIDRAIEALEVQEGSNPL